MLTRQFQIKLDVGLHARPAALFVQTCNRFDSEIILKRDCATVNAKSIIGVMGLGVALETIEQFFEEKMKEK